MIRGTAFCCVVGVPATTMSFTGGFGRVWSPSHVSPRSIPDAGLAWRDGFNERRVVGHLVDDASEAGEPFGQIVNDALVVVHDTPIPAGMPARRSFAKRCATGRSRS